MARENQYQEADDRSQLSLDELERRIADEFSRAQQDMQRTADEYFRDLQRRDDEMRQQVAAGKITEQQYKSWRLTQLARGERFNAMRDKMAARATLASEVAAAYINDTTPGIYSLNRNFAGYIIEKYSGDIDFTLWDEQTVRRLIMEHPDLMPYYPEERAIARGIDQVWGRKVISRSVTQSIILGESIPKMANRIAGTITNMSRNSAVRAARTAVTGAENGGRLAGFEAARAKGIDVQKEWLATLDGRTRFSHRMMDGKVAKLEDKFPNGCKYPGDPDGPPHEVYNCFIGETVVTSDSEIIRGYKHKYFGDLVCIETASGVSFTCTPNHPILTPFGWEAAASLDNGDNIVVTRIRDGVNSGRNPDVYHIHSRFDAIFEFLEKFLGERASALGVDFHGDIATSEVEVVTLKGKLRLNRDAGGGKCVNELLLKLTNKAFSGKGTLMEHFWRVCTTALGVMRGACEAFSVLGGRLRHSEKHRFRPVAGLDFGVSEDTVDDLTAEAERLGELFNGLPGEVSLDEIVNVKIISAGCAGVHVYNLQTGAGYYFVNGSKDIINHVGEKCNGIFAIAHNCRCTLVSNIAGIDTTDAQRRARNAQTGKNEVISNMTYSQWAGWKQEYQKAPVYRPTAAEIAAGAAAGVGLRAAVAKSMGAFGKKHQEILMDDLEKSPQEIQDMFAAYGPELQRSTDLDPWTGRRARDGRAYYSPKYGTVTLHPSEVMAGDSCHVPGGTYFHEYGHNIDHLMGQKASGDKDTLFSSYWKNADGKTFEEIINDDALRDIARIYGQNNYGSSNWIGIDPWEKEVKSVLNTYRKQNGSTKEYKALLKEYNQIKKDDWRATGFSDEGFEIWDNFMESHKDQLLIADAATHGATAVDVWCRTVRREADIYGNGDLSDMVSKTTIQLAGKTYPLDVGHKREYYSTAGNVGTEGFAELTSAFTTNPESLEQIKKHLPNVYSSYLEMIKEGTGLVNGN